MFRDSCCLQQLLATALCDSFLELFCVTAVCDCCLKLLFVTAVLGRFL